jgi:hypothetical protein
MTNVRKRKHSGDDTSNGTWTIEIVFQSVSHEGVAHVCYSFGPLRDLADERCENVKSYKTDLGDP